jgi:DnaD/phage-associated family protein
MAYRLVYSDFWTDPRVMEEMSPEDKFFYLYILTNPSTTNCGIYRITKKQIAFELGHSIETVNTIMDRFEMNYKLIAYNKETRELAVKNWGRYNLSRGGKPVIDCLTSELSRVKDKGLIAYVLNNISNQVIYELYQSFCHKPTKGERDVPPQGDNTYTDTDTDTNTNTYTERDTNTEKDTEEEEAQKLSLSIIQEYEKVTGNIGILNLGSVKLAVTQHGYNNVKKAIDKALEKGKLSMSYINGILRTWAKEGYPKEEGGDCFGSFNKDTGAGPGKFAGFKPQEPKGLTEEERRDLEDSLL